MRFLFAVLLLALPLGMATAAPSPDLWKYWSQHDNQNQENIDHAAFTRLLKKYVVADGSLNRVRYGAVGKADKKALEDYIGRLEDTKITGYRKSEQQAYWINLYNAVTVDLIVENYPVKSIRKIGGGLFSAGPWDDKIITVEGKPMSLNDIEHRILRPLWKTPLNHYGVNCASIGCPNLRSQAYTGQNVTQALRANARDYINSARGAKFSNGELQVSKIYDWFNVDFGGSQTAVISHLRQYATPERSAKLDAAGGIDDYYYDWSLNDAK